MELHVQVFAALACGVLVFCLLTAWARRGKFMRWSIIALGVALASGSYPVMVSLLSRPKDVTEEWYYQNAKEALVSGVYVDEGVALYLYLILPELAEPRSYKFPWNDETRKLAQDLQKALEEAQGGGVMIPYPFQPSLEREKPLTASPVPQPALPPKKQPTPPMHYRSAEWDEGVRDTPATYTLLEPKWYDWWWV